MRHQTASTYFAASLGLLGLGALAGLGAARQRPAPRGAPPPAEARRPAPPPTAAGGTLLDEVGRTAGAASAQQVMAWKRSLHAGCLGSRRAAWLHLWLGEVALGQEEQPLPALWHFREARRLASAGDGVRQAGRAYEGARGIKAEAEPHGARERFAPFGGSRQQCRGLAAYDAALGLYYAGEYQESAAVFHHLLAARPAAVGFERRRAALWCRHAGACAGYHAERSRLGIPEPAKLDPACGAAGLAVCLRGLKLPYDRQHVLAACRVGGEGSSLQDLESACPKLGVSGRAVTADEAGLKALPKPLVAYVEHDHFIAVVRADAKGVAYVCSDCGCWPGGRVDLTWKQWRALEPTAFLVVSRARSQTDRLLSRLPLPPGSPGASSPTGAGRLLQIASTALSHLHLWGVAHDATLFALLKGHVFTLPAARQPICGSPRVSLHCAPTIACPMDSGGGCSGAGPSAGDPVNLATGEEEYQPPPDLLVYNPHGPSLAWSRSYQSLRGPDPAAETDDLGVGWSHPYDGMVVDANYLLNPQAVIARATTFPHSTFDPPADGNRWDIVFNGSIIANDTTPNGWTVTYQYPYFTITPPLTAASAVNYEVRWFLNDFTSVSTFFDVVPLGSYSQGANPVLTPTGSDTPASGLWDVVLGGNIVASAAQPNGWGFRYISGNGTFVVQIPLNAAVASNYEVRFYQDLYDEGSAFFSVIASRYQVQSGKKYLQFPNGSRIGFTAPAIPSGSQPSVTCAADPGAPFTATWYYDAGSPYGHYAITFADGSKWVMTGASKWFNPNTGPSGPSSLCYQLAQLVDRSGNAVNFNYGAAGPSGFPLLATITDASNGQALLTFSRAADGTGNLLSATDAYGRSVYYQERAYLTENVPYPYAQSYQELTTVSEIVPNGTVNPPARYTYGYGNVSNGEQSETVPFLTSITVPSPAGGSSTAFISYDPATDYVYSLTDANGNVHQYSSPDTNHTQVSVYAPGGMTPLITKVIGYDSQMHPTSIADGTGAGSHTFWSAQYADPNDPDRPSAIWDGASSDPGVLTTTMLWDMYGHLTSVTSPRSTTVTYTWHYDAFPLGRLAQVQEGSKTPTTLTYFEPSGLVQQINTPTPGTSGSMTTVPTSFTYDSLGDVLTVTGPGNNAATTITATLNYTNDPGDPAHGVPAYSQPAAVGQPLTITDNLGKVAHMRYNRRALLIDAYDPLGNERAVSYNIADQPVLTAAPMTHQTGPGCAAAASYYLYPGGPLVAMKQFDESGNAVRQASITYGPEGEFRSRSGNVLPLTVGYDAAMRIVSLADGRNPPTLYSYNGAGYLSLVTLPGGETVQYPMYDNHGRSLQRVDGRGLVANYLYNDASGRLTDIQYPATPSLNVHFGYDLYGRLSTVTDGTGSRSIAYDDLNNPTSITTTYSGVPAQTIGYGYYPDASRQSMTTPAGGFSYSYDGDGRLVGLINPYSESFGWGYLDNGWLATQQLSSPMQTALATTTYTRSATGTLTDLTTRNSSNAILSEFGNLTYDGAGNRLSMTATMPAAPSFAGLTSFQYDPYDELTQETSARNGSYSNSFGYDSAGNPTTFKGATQSFNANNQNSAWTFDQNGNPTTYKGVTLTFGPENYLTAYGSALTAGYRADGLRAWKQAGSTRTYFLYDGATPVLEFTANGMTTTVTAVNSFAATGLLARRSGSASTFYTFGPQGSVAQRLSSTGAVLSSHAYDAFGSPLGAPAAGEPFGYGAQAGYYTDQETGLVLCGQRYYDPAQGRFLNRDPSGYQGGINLYAYCGSSPANQADPSGLGGGDQWYDRLGQLAQSSAGTAKGFYNDGLTDPSFGTAGVLAATAVNTGIDIVSGLFQLPEMLSHLGEGTECFWDHPSWDTLPYLVQDIGVAGAAVGAVGAASLGAAAEAEVAEGGEVATAESAGEGAECTRGGCFAAGVPVRMADGSTKPVEQIQPGDRVKSRDPETGVVAAKRVARTFVHTVDHLVVLTLPGGEQIETTEVHPFYVAGRGFVEAGKLGIGTSIVTRAGPALTIAQIERRPGRVRVYNFEVEGFHTYFVGQSGGGVWVHNAIPCDGEPGPAPEEAEAAPAKAPPDLANLSKKIVDQSARRGWTPPQIKEAFESGEQHPALDMHESPPAPATRYVHPETGQSVVINDATGRVIQVGGPGFLF